MSSPAHRAERINAIAIVLESLLACAALYGARAFFRDPTGRSIGIAEGTELLDGTPFHDYLWPGLILFVANGLIPLVAANLGFFHSRWAPQAHLIAGLSLTGWMLGQLSLLGYLSFLQAILLVLGLLMIVLALMMFASTIQACPKEASTGTTTSAWR